MIGLSSNDYQLLPLSLSLAPSEASELSAASFLFDMSPAITVTYYYECDYGSGRRVNLLTKSDG